MPFYWHFRSARRSISPAVRPILNVRNALGAAPQMLTFVKVFHWLVQDRVDYMETTPATSRLAHLRIVSFMALLVVRPPPVHRNLWRNYRRADQAIDRIDRRAEQKYLYKGT